MEEMCGICLIEEQINLGRPSNFRHDRKAVSHSIGYHQHSDRNGYNQYTALMMLKNICQDGQLLLGFWQDCCQVQ